MNWTTLFKKFTNGKYIVGLLAIAFLSIGSFSNAYVYGPVVNYSTVQQIQVPSDALGLEFFSVSPDGAYFNFEFDCGAGCRPSNMQQGGYYNVGDTVTVLRSDNNNPYTSFNITCLNQINGSWVNCNDTQSLQFKFYYNEPPIIEGGTSNFTPIITKLGNIAKEFIPYMIYIVITCLGVTLAFKALRYIIGYLQSKSKGAVRGK